MIAVLRVLIGFVAGVLLLVLGAAVYAGECNGPGVERIVICLLRENPQHSLNWLVLSRRTHSAGVSMNRNARRM